MSGPTEVVAGTVGVIVLAITLAFVPVPRPKPPEIDQQAKQETPTPQEVIVLSVKKEEQPIALTKDEAKLDSIELKLMHIQKQVEKMELKAERLR